MSTLIENLIYKPAELSFGTSGLRGPVTDITDLEAYINTLGFIEFLISNQGLTKDTPIYFAGDLRSSTPRILKSINKAIIDSGQKSQFGGFVPTPAISYFALQKNAPCIMVTGSHIPDDRNGIKFYKLGGEVLKDDEQPIKQSVAEVRNRLYSREFNESDFDARGILKEPSDLPETIKSVEEEYIKRYVDCFDNISLSGKDIIFYQHSAVGRDIIPQILSSLGAVVKCVDRSEVFIPIDTENVTPDNQTYFKKLASDNSGAFAIVSTDGDSDRPFVIDENGVFHRGDDLGAVVAKWLNADFAVIPISSSDAVDKYLTEQGIKWEHTRIGSPYVIKTMSESGADKAVGWEVNGGFLTGTDIELKNILKALPTRDAVLPILVSLVAASETNIKLSELFNDLPKRFTGAGLIDNFPIETSKTITELFSTDSPETRQKIESFFNIEKGFGQVQDINTLDGIRIFFDNGDIAHIRASNNAPQLRIYSVANTQERAEEIVKLALEEPDGILRTIEKSI